MMNNRAVEAVLNNDRRERRSRGRPCGTRSSPPGSKAIAHTSPKRRRAEANSVDIISRDLILSRILTNSLLSEKKERDHLWLVVGRVLDLAVSISNNISFRATSTLIYYGGLRLSLSCSRRSGRHPPSRLHPSLFVSVVELITYCLRAVSTYLPLASPTRRDRQNRCH